MFKAYHANYGDKYAKRNAYKLEQLLPRFSNESILDIGCNNGYLCAGILNAYEEATCTGLELSDKPLLQELREHPRFKLIVGNVAETQLSPHDVVVYNSVHHHIFEAYGPERAMNVLSGVFDLANRAVVFETGVVAEQGNFSWKKALKKFFGSDEAHLEAVVEAAGTRFQNIEIVCSPLIHGVPRNVYWIDLAAPTNLESSGISQD